MSHDEIVRTVAVVAAVALLAAPYRQQLAQYAAQSAEAATSRDTRPRLRHGIARHRERDCHARSMATESSRTGSAYYAALDRVWRPCGEDLW